MAISRTEKYALAGAAAVALLLPAGLLLPGDLPRREDARAAQQLLSPAPVPPIRRLFDRPLFTTGNASEAAAAATGDAPELVGIAGRLNRDAVAMVRTAEGGTRALKPGDSIDGWRLESLAIDAAYFTRGSARARVDVPAGDQ